MERQASYVPSVETHAISSDLTGAAADQVVALWRKLRARFGLRSAEQARTPHVTFVVGEIDSEALRQSLPRIVQDTAPLEVELGGVYAFESESPVVYLRVDTSPALVTLHRRVLAVAKDVGMQIWPWYGEADWIPHVTLALYDVERSRLDDVMAEARQYTGDIRWHTRLESLALVRLGPLTGTRRPYSFVNRYPFHPEENRHAV